MGDTVYEPQGIRFTDLCSWRSMLLVTEDGPIKGWLCFRHPDGQWVTERKATAEEVERIMAVARVEVFVPAGPRGEEG